MKLRPQLWPALESYLFLDIKLSRNRAAYLAVKSRFNILAQNFTKRDFNRQTCTTFMGEMQEKGYASSHINNMIKIAKHVDKYLGLNELQDFTYFREEIKHVAVLTPEEIYQMANVVIPYTKEPDLVNERQRLLILFLATTGCRISEALNLTTADFLDTPPHVIFRATKNGDTRAVPIANFLHSACLRLGTGRNFIFSSYRGEHLDLQQINLDLKRRAKACHITKPVYCHVFRHSYITTMLQAGVDALDVAVIVGHHDPKTTLRYKNSVLTHYAAIIDTHPLLRRSITLDIIGKRVKDMVGRLIDPAVFPFTIQETGTEFRLTISKYGK